VGFGIGRERGREPDPLLFIERKSEPDPLRFIGSKFGLTARDYTRAAESAEVGGEDDNSIGFLIRSLRSLRFRGCI
jgi:hypothetical protein